MAVKFTTEYRLKKSNGFVKLQPTNPNDMALFDKLIGTGKEYFTGQFSTIAERRTYSQLKTVWKLVEVIFRSQNETHRKPTEDEKNELYEDLKVAYADKRPSTLNPNVLVPVGMSTADIESSARFIQALINHLADYCDLNVELGTEVRGILTEWENWRGSLEHDPLDDVTEKEWREKKRVSDASGIGGVIEKAHIVSRGADVSAIDEAWNWLALTPDEHREQHKFGWVAFLRKYPHLRGRVDRARALAKKRGYVE